MHKQLDTSFALNHFFANVPGALGVEHGNGVTISMHNTLSTLEDSHQTRNTRGITDAKR